MNINKIKRMLKNFKNRNITKGKVKLIFSNNLGGMLTNDTFDLIKLISIEVRRSTDKLHEYSQSYKCINPDIIYGKNWYRVRGYLTSYSKGVIPVKYDILTKYNGRDVNIEFKLLFEESLTKVEMIKAWCFINANQCIVLDDDGKYRYNLKTDSDIFKIVYEGKLNKIMFTNDYGSMVLLSKESNVFSGDRIWKQKKHSEYVMLWHNDNDFPTIEKDKFYKCTWNIRYLRC